MERARQVLRWHQRSEIAKTMVLLLIVVCVTLGGFGIFMLIMGTTSPLVVVISDSMVPNLERGDLLIIQARSADQISVGDIVVYQDDDIDTDGLVVHRVVSIEFTNDTYYFYTGGDANAENDPGTRTIDEIVGVVVLRIPYLGSVSIFLRSPTGLVLIVLFIIIILILPEILRKKNNTNDQESVDGNDIPSEVSFCSSLDI